MSSLEAGYGKEADSAATDYSIYNSPKTQFIVDDKGRVILQKITSKELLEFLIP
jgi:hypothetical protein